jgi:hypothetical protein
MANRWDVQRNYMAELWDGVGEAAMAEPTRRKRGLLGGCDAHAASETSVGMLQAR